MDDAPAERPVNRGHIRLVTAEAEAGAVDPGALHPERARPRSIGRLIAQTAQLAESAVTRRSEVQRRTRPTGSHGIGGRILRRLR